MVGILMSVLCILLSLIHVPNLIEGKTISIVAFVFCLLCALINLILGILSIKGVKK